MSRLTEEEYEGIIRLIAADDGEEEPQLSRKV